MPARLFLAAIILTALATLAHAQSVPPLCSDVDSAYRLWDGQTKQVNALWGENPAQMKFGNGNKSVVIADLKGPGVITMIHFALPAAMRMNRDVVLRIYWDNEKTPSVEAPLADFFCDPNGSLERVESVLVNKKRGWNAYFPMPFAKSARLEVSSDNPHYPAVAAESCPCYSYVIYRTLKKLPPDAGYFHSCWRQKTLLLGKEEYDVFEALGKGQFVGWNVTVRGVGAQNAGYPVDENVKFYVDGEKEPSIEWQGIEDSFGFSWGFPEQANGFAYTGYQPYLGNGAAAYRFTLNDRISFKKSFKMGVGFGKNEGPMFRREFSKPENPLQFSSVAYWYQKEPHKAFVPLPPARSRKPVEFKTDKAKYTDAGETLIVNCGDARRDVEFLADGWDFVLQKGYTYSGWSGEVRHCWADIDSLKFEVLCPKGVSGTLKLYILDGDNFKGGRKQSVEVAGKMVGQYEDFQSGRWIEVPISSAITASGRIPVVMKNLKADANAVVSTVRFVKSGN